MSRQSNDIDMPVPTFIQNGGGPSFPAYDGQQAAVSLGKGEWEIVVNCLLHVRAVSGWYSPFDDPVVVQEGYGEIMRDWIELVVNKVVTQIQEQEQ